MTAETAAAAAADPGIRPGDLRRRVLRHFLPLAIATFAALAALVSIPFFDANRYPPPGAIFAEGAKGALPDGDTPRPGEPTDAGVGSGRQRPANGEHGDGAAPSAPSTTAPSGHTGPPPGAHGSTRETTTPTTAQTRSPGASHGTGNSAQGETGAASGSMGGDHAGDQDTVLQMRRLSTMTGYFALVLIAVTLLIGPVSLLRGRRVPVSTYLRRDIGIWSAGVSIAHVVFGFLAKHGDGQLLGYFFEAGDRSRILTNAFGLANWAGLAAVVIVAGLAAISSDWALHRLKAKRWKRLQRWNYALALLTAAHAVLYGALWRLSSPYTITLVSSTALVVVAQAIGVRLWRRRRWASAEA